MFKVIGADGRLYGPATAAQVEEWIRAGRVAGHTLALADGSTDWHPIGQFPEFASMITPNIPPMLSSVAGQRSKVAAGLMGILLGGLGVHRFYLGFIGLGIIQIVVTFVTCGLGAVWGLIEGILILAGSTITTDAEGRPLRQD